MSGGTRAVTSTDQGQAGSDAEAAAVMAASERWEAFRLDPRGREFCLEDEVVRDAALDISSILRPVRLISTHPLDQICVAAVPAQMEVHFHAPPALLYQADRRDIAITPSQEEFLGWHGLLPAVDVTREERAADGGTVITWRVAAPGEDALACFVFEPGAALLARASLVSLAKAASMRREAFEHMVNELQHNADVSIWNTVRRTLASHFWSDLPGRARQRVLDYFRNDARAAALVSGADIGAALREGSSAPLVAVAGELLLAGLLYWQQRCAAGQVPDGFWDVEMARAVPFNARGVDFGRAMQTTLDAHACWLSTRQFYRDVMRDMDRSDLASDARYLHQRARLSRALLRGGGQRVGKSGSVARALLDHLDAAQVRQRLSDAMPMLVAVAPPGSLAFYARLAQVLHRVIAPPPLMLDGADVVDEAAMQRDALRCDHDEGLSVLAYYLAPSLPPTRVGAVWALQPALLPNGALPLQRVSKEDPVDADTDMPWRRVYRFNAPCRFDVATQSWQASMHEVSIEGRNLRQRRALDRHMAALVAGLVAQQRDYFRRGDQARIVIDRHADVLLVPASRFARRQVRFIGSGGRLVLPAQLRGTVQIDCSGLDAQAPAPVLQLDPALAASLQQGASARRGTRCFTTWRGAGCMLLVEASQQGRCAQALALQLDVQARSRLHEDMCNPAVSQVELSTAITGDLELVPPGRDIVLQAYPGAQRLVLRCLGRAATRLRVQAAEHPMPFSLSIDLRGDTLPRYRISALECDAAGARSGQVIDTMTGACLQLELAAGVSFDQATWEQARSRIAGIDQQALANVTRWSAQLGASPALEVAAFREVLACGVQLNALEHHLLASKAAILQAQWSAELPSLDPGAAALSASALGPERLAQARQIVCRMVAYLFKDALSGWDDLQWRQLLRDDQARSHALPLQRVLALIGGNDARCRQQVLVFCDAQVAASGARPCAGSASALIFTGTLESACQWWTWQLHEDKRLRAHLTFQQVPGMGWLLQPPHGPRSVLQAMACDGAVGAPTTAGASAWRGIGDHLAVALRAIKAAGLCRSCPHLAAPPWVDEQGAWRADLPLCALSDLAGNSYLLVGEAAASVRQWQGAQRGVCSMTVRASLAGAGEMLSAAPMQAGQVTLLPQDALRQVFGDGERHGAELARRLHEAIVNAGKA